MIILRKAEERGHFDHGWLNTYHTFSFADYLDRRHMGFRALRVINDDRVAPGRGFGMHPHQDMEIVTYILSGGLQHRDNMGNGSVIRSGDVQRMSAGTGVLHSEANASGSEWVHLLQIWILPETRGLQPGYEQKFFSPEDLSGRLRLIASRDGSEGSVTIHQDARIYAGKLGPGVSIKQPLSRQRHAWVHVARGEVDLNGHGLKTGDGAAISEEDRLQLRALADSEILVFDLA